MAPPAMLCLIVLLIKPLRRPSTLDTPPPFTVCCSRLVRLREQLFTLRVTPTTRLRQITTLQALSRTGPRTLLVKLTPLCLRPWPTNPGTSFVLSGFGWQRVSIEETLLRLEGPRLWITRCTLEDLSRKILLRLFPLSSPKAVGLLTGRLLGLTPTLRADLTRLRAPRTTARPSRFKKLTPRSFRVLILLTQHRATIRLLPPCRRGITLLRGLPETIILVVRTLKAPPAFLTCTVTLI